MDRLPGSDGTHHGDDSFGMMQGSAAPLLDISLRQIAVQRRGSITVAIDQPHRAKTGVAKLNSFRQHGLEHRLQFAGRAGDGAQHLRSRGLLLTCLFQLLSESSDLFLETRNR